MDKTLLKGYDLIEKHFGHFPTFHDDYINSISIESNHIDFIIKMESSLSCDNSNKNELLKLTFKDTKQFNLHGEFYGVVSIIRDIYVTKNGEDVETVIETSMGTEGTITSKEIEISLL